MRRGTRFQVKWEFLSFRRAEYVDPELAYGIWKSRERSVPLDKFGCFENGRVADEFIRVVEFITVTVQTIGSDDMNLTRDKSWFDRLVPLLYQSPHGSFLVIGEQYALGERVDQDTVHFDKYQATLENGKVLKSLLLLKERTYACCMCE